MNVHIVRQGDTAIACKDYLLKTALINHVAVFAEDEKICLRSND